MCIIHFLYKIFEILLYYMAFKKKIHMDPMEHQYGSCHSSISLIVEFLMSFNHVNNVLRFLL